MTQTSLFKQVAAKNLPKSLFQQLEPHLNTLINNYEENKQICAEIEYIDSKYLYARYNKIKAEFNEISKPMWLFFARERWPEIDHFFDLSPSEEFDKVFGWDDELPF